MKNLFSIGHHAESSLATPASNAVRMDLDRLVETRMLIQANSGGGKSYTTRKILEETHGKVQHIIIDPEDEFYTLREKYDYVLAGRHGGDCPTDPQHAGMLARRILELGVSTILGIYELTLYDRLRFVANFLKELNNAPKHLWHPVLVVIDEAHVFAPQHGHADSLMQVIDLMTRGRKRGFCGVLCTQRISKIHKDAVAEANNKLIGRCGLDVDMKRSGEELGFTGRGSETVLRDLKAGEFYAFGPAFEQKYVSTIHIGKTLTTHPRVGKLISVVPPARETIKKMLVEFANLPKEAEEEARNIKELQDQNRDLQKQMRSLQQRIDSKPAAAPSDAMLKAAEEGGARMMRDALQPHLDKITTYIMTLRAKICRISSVSMELGKLTEVEEFDGKCPTLDGVLAKGLALKGVRALITPTIKTVADTPKNHFTAIGNGHPTLNSDTYPMGKCERMILKVLFQYPQGRSKNQVAVISGYSVGSGGFNNSLSALRSRGLIQGSGECLTITASGEELIAGAVDPLPQGAELLRYWMNKLGKCEGTILNTLAGMYPEGMNKGQLGEATQYSSGSGGFNNALSRLRTLELITGYDRITASVNLFQ